jgi:hypothetical protein
MSENLERPSYYATIPANVRYSEDVSASAKLLYAEITALCNKTGTCWASNQYFADLYSVTTDAVSRWVKQLADAGFVTTKVNRNAGNKRYIRIDTPTYKKVDTYNEKSRFNTNNKINNNNTDANASDAPKENENDLDQTSFGGKKKKAADPPPTLKLMWDVVKKYGLPVTNANHIRKWANDLNKTEDGEQYLQALMDNDLRSMEGDFRPTLNSAFDVIQKKLKVQRFLNGGEDAPKYDPRVYQ